MDHSELDSNEKKSLIIFSRKIDSDFPNLLINSNLEDPLSFHKHKIKTYFIKLYLRLLKEDDLIITDYYSELIHYVNHIQRKSENDFIDKWKRKIFASKKNFEELKELLFEWEEFVFLNKENVTLSLKYKAFDQYLITDNEIVTSNGIKEIEELINFYLSYFIESTVQQTISKTQFIWTGEKIDFLEVLRSLKMSKRIKRMDGKDITFKDVIEMFSFITLEKTDQSVTEKELTDEVIKGYKKGKRHFDNKFYLDELNSILIKDKENRKSNKE